MFSHTQDRPRSIHTGDPVKTPDRTEIPGAHVKCAEAGVPVLARDAASRHYDSKNPTCGSCAQGGYCAKHAGD
jgi:hypothetical protein